MDGTLLLSPKPSRTRSKPNLSVSELHYKEGLHSLLVAEPMLHMKHKLGPELALHLKQVTPGHLVTLEKLWHKLISSGCQQLVLQSQQIRSALHALVSESSFLIPVGTPPIKVPVIIDDVKGHIMDCSAMMRALKNAGMPGAAHHTEVLASALKRNMVECHLLVLTPILALMQHSDAVINETARPCPLSPPLPYVPPLPP